MVTGVKSESPHLGILANSKVLEENQVSSPVNSRNHMLSGEPLRAGKCLSELLPLPGEETLESQLQGRILCLLRIQNLASSPQLRFLKPFCKRPEHGLLFSSQRTWCYWPLYHSLVQGCQTYPMPPTDWIQTIGLLTGQIWTW